MHRHRRCTHTEERPHDGQLQDKERELRRNQTCWHLHLGVLASRTMRKYMSVVCYPVCGTSWSKRSSLGYGNPLCLLLSPCFNCGCLLPSYFSSTFWVPGSLDLLDCYILKPSPVSDSWKEFIKLLFNKYRMNELIWTKPIGNVNDKQWGTGLANSS